MTEISMDGPKSGGNGFPAVKARFGIYSVSDEVGWMTFNVASTSARYEIKFDELKEIRGVMETDKPDAEKLAYLQNTERRLQPSNINLSPAQAGVHHPDNDRLYRS